MNYLKSSHTIIKTSILIRKHVARNEKKGGGDGTEVKASIQRKLTNESVGTPTLTLSSCFAYSY